MPSPSGVVPTLSLCFPSGAALPANIRAMLSSFFILRASTPLPLKAIQYRIMATNHKPTLRIGAAAHSTGSGYGPLKNHRAAPAYHDALAHF